MLTTGGGDSTRPSAHITIGHDRLKVYENNQVYMNDGQEFKLELHNPFTTNILITIRMNGTLISSRGLIIQPGQRIYLDRYLDTTSKFRFNTYTIEDTAENNSAIINNGQIDIMFYHEIQPIPMIRHYSYPYFQTDQNYYNYPTFNTDMSIGTNFTAMYSNRTSEKVTGRIGTGECSDQKFTNSDGTYSSIAFHACSYKVLPKSELPLILADIRQYCTKCNARLRKSTWKFCPKCGNII